MHINLTFLIVLLWAKHATALFAPASSSELDYLARRARQSAQMRMPSVFQGNQIVYNPNLSLSARNIPMDQVIVTNATDWALDRARDVYRFNFRTMNEPKLNDEVANPIEVVRCNGEDAHCERLPRLLPHLAQEFRFISRMRCNFVVHREALKWSWHDRAYVPDKWIEPVCFVEYNYVPNVHHVNLESLLFSIPFAVASWVATIAYLNCYYKADYVESCVRRVTLFSLFKWCAGWALYYWYYKDRV